MHQFLDTPLRQLADDIAAPKARRHLYDALTAQRDAEEPRLNAFEARREICPKTANGPLNGLPITVKDQIAAAGWPRGFGAERIPPKPDRKSASLVARLEDLGAVVTGKTALPPNAMDFQTSNTRRGPTRNPHDPAFTCGGSTGGGAAAVASGMSLVDVGADLSGSLRLPAAWCGVTSFVPGEGGWGNDGLLRGDARLAHFARAGLTARRVEDLAFLWSALEGTPVPDRKTEPRLALWSPAGQAPCDDQTLGLWHTFRQRITASDIAVEDTSMDMLFTPDVYRLGGEIIGHETGALVPWIIRWFMRRDRRGAQMSPGFVAHVNDGYRRDAGQYQRNLDHLADLRAAAQQSWAHVDALVLPVSGVCAFRHIKPARDQNGVRTYDTMFETGAGPLGYFDALTRFALPITALGWPVVTLPIGRDSNGIPVGAQLVGKPGSDGDLIAIAAGLQDLFAAS
ncbi:amidase [Gymnodinialimonas sp. 2305UL16-5]|uniref:amidase n=1 Tax=Gymnodinialimonas mytili TaxID=3126503 RepID=UPI0030A55FEC